jgi:hypothetical protein
MLSRKWRRGDLQLVHKITALPYSMLLLEITKNFLFIALWRLFASVQNYEDVMRLRTCSFQDYKCDLNVIFQEPVDSAFIT